MISNRHMYVQFINDDLGVTMASVSTAGTDVKVTVATAKALGLQAAADALSKGIGSVVVDRGGCRFHGRVKAIVDGAIEGGLSIGVMKEAT
jgi:large subunit ribosomal protein L18